MTQKTCCSKTPSSVKLFDFFSEIYNFSYEELSLSYATALGISKNWRRQKFLTCTVISSQYNHKFQ